MKKIFKYYISLLFIGSIILLLLTACSPGESKLKMPKPNKDEMYKNLDSSIKSPSADLPSNIAGKLNFTAMLVSEAYDMTLDTDEDTVYRYQNAVIARDLDNIFLLNVTNVEEMEPGTILFIEGEIDGFIYDVVDNKNVEILNIIAKSIKPYEPVNNAIESNIIEVDRAGIKGSIEIEKAFSIDNKGEKNKTGPALSNMFNQDIIKLYLNYENTGIIDSAPSFSDLGHIYVGDYELKINSMPMGPGADIKVESNRLIMDYGLATETYPGKKSYYSISLSPAIDDVKLDLSQPIVFEDYDDDFNLIKYYQMDITLLDKDNLLAE